MLTKDGYTINFWCKNSEILKLIYNIVPLKLNDL